ncbi:MAG: hypothetical protein M3Z25_04390 [Actinomycetota bacterium]|nr:hypothetical protein [Actinomycetota bacterium]
MTRATVAGEDFDFDAADIERAVAEVDPEPVREHYVVIGRRRYPPKQVLALVTGLDRAVRGGALAASERPARHGLAGAGDF